MSGNAKQRRKARRAAARAPMPAAGPPIVIPPAPRGGIYLTADDILALATLPAPPVLSPWLVAGGIVALVVVVAAFIFWVATIPAGR